MAYRRGKKAQTAQLNAKLPSPASTLTVPTRPRLTIKQMGKPSVSIARVFSRIPEEYLEAYHSLQVSVLRFCTTQAHINGPASKATKDAIQ